MDALLELIEEGDLQPTATRIAERAGISLRLIYHHYGDLESLFRAAALRQFERMNAQVTPVDRDLPLHGRIDALVERRCAMLEWITPVRRAELLQEPWSPELRAARAAVVARGNREVAVVFAPELDRLAPADVATVRHALEAALGWGAWNDLREAGVSVDDATAAVRVTVQRLLDLPGS